MRTSGILLPISSIPSQYGIGCFSKEAYTFVDQLARAGQTYWQILPLGPTGYGDSPYQSFSAFAGNPYFIDLDQLKEEGLLREEEYACLDWGEDLSRVSYDKQYQNRLKVLKLAFDRANLKQNEDFAVFCKEEQDWLEDFALYMAVKGHNGQRSWTDWDDAVRLRKTDALTHYREICSEQILFYQYLQFLFFRQWSALKQYANEKGVRIIGDIPIYVAFDGADSWSHPELFQFDENRNPVRVAGCPPDAFSADGQLWGNPLYDWDYHERTGYAWWIRRMKHCFRLYDVVRVDHFRGFDEYFTIPYGDLTAAGGSWVKGPGMKLFRAIEEKLGKVPIIAEDLGFMTDSVVQLVKDSGHPNMKVIEFAFDSREAGDYMPYGYGPNSVVYTGTHDNQTLLAWLDELIPGDRVNVENYLGLEGADKEALVWALIRLTLATASDTAVIPMQDYLVLGSEARMNQPSTMGKNWQWRLGKADFDEALILKIKKMTDIYGRTPKQ